MRSFSGTQITVIAGAIIFAVILYLAPNKKEQALKETVSEEKPGNSKLQQAISLVQQGAEPMRGIMMLREILEENPDNEEAHYYLGLFSIQSGQYEKAIERFTKVLEINSSNIDALYQLGFAFLQTGQRENALNFFEKYTASANADSNKKAEAIKYINELKNS
jgi:outer membrane protein